MSEASLFDPDPFDDGRGRYPDRIAANVPRALGQVTRSVAAAQGVTTAEFVRRTLVRAVTESNAAVMGGRIGEPRP
jgi:hypothetical protein